VAACAATFFHLREMPKQILTAALLLTALAAAAADPEKLKAVADDAIGLAKDQEAALEEAGTEIVTLQQRIEALSTGKKEKPSFTLKGKGDFEVLHGVNYNNKHYTPEEIAENAQVQKALVEGGSTAVSKKEKVTE
jgi:hypothetical protein